MHIVITYILYATVIFPIIAFCAVVIWWRLFVHPKTELLHFRNALILAAHPDDCVIMAGEYGIESLRKGNSVTIVCMTCGDIDADSDYAKTRRSEMLLAWSKAKLPPENITFIDAPESKVSGPVNQNPEWISKIEKILSNKIIRLPISPIVILPAAGELHTDHRTLRKLAINAIFNSNRHDIEVYESPEYSNYCSLICNPFGAIRNILRLIPIGRRVAKYVNWGTSYPHYSTFRFGAMKPPYDEQRFKLKCEMLSAFKSQGSEKMIEYFGKPDVYRQLIVKRELDEDELLPGIELKGIVYSRLTIAFAASLFVSIISLVLLHSTA